MNSRRHLLPVVPSPAMAPTSGDSSDGSGGGTSRLQGEHSNSRSSPPATRFYSVASSGDSSLRRHVTTGCNSKHHEQRLRSKFILRRSAKRTRFRRPRTCCLTNGPAASTPTFSPRVSALNRTSNHSSLVTHAPFSLELVTFQNYDEFLVRYISCRRRYTLSVMPCETIYEPNYYSISLHH